MEVKRQIDAIVEIFRNVFEINQKKLIDFLKDNNYEISAATLNRTLKNPEAHLLKSRRIISICDKYLHDYNYEYNYIQKKYLRISHHAKSKLELFYNTKWYLFFFEYDENKQSGIGRANIEITEKGVVKLQNVPKSGATNYLGYSSIHLNNNNLLLQLNTEETNEKHLFINIIINEGSIYNLNVGLYTNIGADGTLFSGTVILLKTEEHTLQPKLFLFNSPDINEIDMDIRQFFRNKHQNEIKVTTNITSTTELHKFLEKNAKKRRAFLHDSYYQYDIYITVAIDSKDKTKVKDEINSIKQIIETIKEKTGFTRIYFANSEIDGEWLKSADILLNEATEAIEKSKYFIFIQLDPVAKGLLETGYALQKCRSLLFVKGQEQNLPFLLQKASNLHSKFSVRTYAFNDLEHLSRLISANGIKLFEE